MKSKEEEFKEIFLAEALDQYEELNRLFTILEKNHYDKPTIEAIFRTTHTLKANAASMGFEAIASMAHVLEDIFSEIKNERMLLTSHIFTELFRANDKLGELIHSIKTGETVSYKGLMVKLKVILQRGREAVEKQKNHTNASNPTPNEPPQNEPLENTATQSQHGPTQVAEVVSQQISTQAAEVHPQKESLQEEESSSELVASSPVPETAEKNISEEPNISETLPTTENIEHPKTDQPEASPQDVEAQEQILETPTPSSLEVEKKEEKDEQDSEKKLPSLSEKKAEALKLESEKKVEVEKSPVVASTVSQEEKRQKQDEDVELLKTPQITFSDLVQVPVKKLDNLLNLVGELAIEKDRLMANNRNVSELASLHRITSDLQYSVMGVRLVQVSVLFQKFHRIVRDIALYENKKVNLILEGTEVEIDRNILQIISDSMIHLVRNAVSHGIELPSERVKMGKSEVGTLRLKARNEKDHVVIDVEDDGRGINPDLIRRKAIEKGMLSPLLSQKMSDDEVIRFIFEPGFSSAEKVTDVSGRGVGMDVVKKSIEAIGGKILMHSQVGKGTRFSLSLPASMAVKSVLLFELQGAEFAIPLSFTEAVISLKKSDIHKVGAGLMATYQEKTMSVVFLNDIFHAAETEFSQPSLLAYLHRSFDQLKEEARVYVIVVSMYNYLVGFVVDRLLQQKEILERPLKPPVDNAKFISGATIMGNGNVCLVLDVNALVDFLFKATSASVEMSMSSHQPIV